jgi:hypothetical protein
VPVAAFAWYLFVLHRTAAEPTALSLLSYPFAGLAGRVVHPPVPHLNPGLGALVIFAGYVALAGVLAALALAALLAAARRLDPRAIAIYLFALMTIMLSARLWSETTDFGRTMSPLVLLLATISLSDAIPAFAVPLIAIAAPLAASRGIFLLNLVPAMVRP